MANTLQAELHFTHLCVQAVNSILKARTEVLKQAAVKEDRLVALKTIRQYYLNQRGAPPSGLDSTAGWSLEPLAGVHQESQKGGTRESW